MFRCCSVEIVGDFKSTLLISDACLHFDIKIGVLIINNRW